MYIKPRNVVVKLKLLQPLLSNFPLTLNFETKNYYNYLLGGSVSRTSLSIILYLFYLKKKEKN